MVFKLEPLLLFTHFCSFRIVFSTLKLYSEYKDKRKCVMTSSLSSFLCVCLCCAEISFTYISFCNALCNFSELSFARLVLNIYLWYLYIQWTLDNSEFIKTSFQVIRICWLVENHDIQIRFRVNFSVIRIDSIIWIIIKRWLYVIFSLFFSGGSVFCCRWHCAIVQSF